MSEDNKKQEEISADEVKKLHDEIKAKETQTIEGVKRDVADAVKKEIKQEHDMEAIKKSNEDLQRALEKQQKDAEERLKKMQEEMSAKIEDINTAQKSVRTNQNPFAGQDGDDSGPLPVDVNNPDVVKEVEEASRQAFVEKYGVDINFGRPN